MSYRQDKLILLLETGTSPQVRQTAAKQLADLTVKTFHATLNPKREEETTDEKPSTSVTLHGQVDEDDAWNQVLETISKLIHLLKSKSSETRYATANSLSLLAKALPPYDPVEPIASSSTSSPIDVQALLRDGRLLLASAGREYVAKVSKADRAKRKKAMEKSMGFGGGLGWGEDVDKEIGEEEDEEDGMDVDKSNEAGKGKSTPKDTPSDPFEGLSARQITMLKRKKGNIVEEANKLRRMNRSSSGTAMPTSAQNSADSTPQTTSPPANNSDQPGAVVIDPGAKARAAAQKGGAVEISMDNFDADGNPVVDTKAKTLTMRRGTSPWMSILSAVQPGLEDPVWYIRHGSSLGIMEVLRFVGSAIPISFTLDLARALLSLLAADRFGDFVGDTVIAPVRETAAQAIGVLLKYLDPSSLEEVHSALIDMVTQGWTKRGKAAEGAAKGEKFSWEVRHAGLLGIKYEVAVRSKAFGLDVEAKEEDVEVEEDIKPTVKHEQASSEEALGFLRQVVEAVKTSLNDVDDDVRTVAASALLPVTDKLTAVFPKDDLMGLLDTLWSCLEGGSDDLGSSTGAVMDLLCELLKHDQIMDILASQTSRFSSVYAFVRHTIPSVRLAVAQTLSILVTDPRLRPLNKWMDQALPCYLYQNLILEERKEIRQLSLRALTAVFEALYTEGQFDVLDDQLEDWYTLTMTPLGVPLDESKMYRAKGTQSGHSVDKPVIAGDLSLVSTEQIVERRLDAAKALALFRRHRSTSDLSHLAKYLQSNSAHQVFMSTVIMQSWAAGKVKDEPAIKAESTNGSTLASDAVTSLLDALVARIESPPAATYYEMDLLLRGLYKECHALLSAFNVEGKISKDKIPSLPPQSDFHLGIAQQVVTEQFDGLARLMGPKVVKTVLPSLKDRQRKVMGSIGYFSIMKERYDVTVSAGVAGALIAFGRMPSKIGPVIKAVMDGVRREEVEVLQSRAAASVAAFVAFCTSPSYTGRVNPVDKVIRNLFTFLNQDTTQTPIFKPDGKDQDTILSLKEDKPIQTRSAAQGIAAPEETEAQIAMRVTRRGALQTFKSLADEFGDKLFDTVPRLWECVSAALTSTFTGDIEMANETLQEAPKGQDVVDCLTSLRLIVPFFDPALLPRLTSLFPAIVIALTSSHAQIRNTAAQCLAGMCDILTDEGMRHVVDHVVPLVGDAKRVHARRGAVEAIHHIIKVLEIKVLPYILFLIVPVLGRMSDSDEPTRLLATSTFASMIKMVPLEAGLPDPPGFSPELLAKRDEERAFLMQLLDGNKAEQYEIPIKIKADLRQYQREGVSWLAFLAKYQLHGILCDDMGLGKSLQSICIIGSKHHERARRHSLQPSPATAHLPSLIVCPPTLTGHWYYEVLKFTDELRPVQYVGQSSERAALRSGLKSADVVIASYDTVRSDIDFLSKIDWLYCVLDEGHIIKNSKTKLSAAIKQLKAQHRLLLSGTPIQNNVLELWSLFDFLMPGFLGSERVFNDRFSKPILADRDGKASPKERDAAAAALEALHKQVLPFLLRRLKEDVLNDLPPKIIQDYYCDLSPVQQALYDEFQKSQAAQDAGEEVEAATSTGGKQTHVFQSLQYLRKLCNHPNLVMQPRDWNKISAKLPGLPPANDISHAPKLEALRQLLLDCGITEKPSSSDDMPQHRVLIFCQLRTMLDLVESQLFKPLMPSLTYMRMDGSTDPRKRHAIVQTFNSDPRIDVLLLTTSVGGLGLNITGADTVIFVDHDWNPMKDLQAMDRAHRLGQKKVVNVYRLITRGTLEEKIMGLQRFKLNIASSVVTQQNAGLGSMNTGEVLDLFKVSSEPSGQGQGQKASGATTSGGSGPMSASKILEGLEDLPPDDEYAEMSMDNFMGKL